MNYECHITVPTKFAVPAEGVAVFMHWKTSEIARDPVLGKDTFFYLTKHHKEYEALFAEMKRMSHALTKTGVPVLREKIEHILYDERYPQ